METRSPVLTVVSKDDGDSARVAAVNLAKNLNSTGVIRATDAKERHTSDPTVEDKSLGVILCALSLEIMKSAAVKMAVEAIVSAQFAAF